MYKIDWRIRFDSLFGALSDSFCKFYDCSAMFAGHISFCCRVLACPVCQRRTHTPTSAGSSSFDFGLRLSIKLFLLLNLYHSLGSVYVFVEVSLFGLRTTHHLSVQGHGSARSEAFRRAGTLTARGNIPNKSIIETVCHGTVYAERQKVSSTSNL